jgi:hypothetical protein
VVLGVPVDNLAVGCVEQVLVEEPPVGGLGDRPHQRWHRDGADPVHHHRAQDGVPGGVPVHRVLRPHGQVRRIGEQLQVQAGVVPGHEVVPDDPALGSELQGDIPLDHGHLDRRPVRLRERDGHGGHGQPDCHAHGDQGPCRPAGPKERREQEAVDGDHDEPQAHRPYHGEERHQEPVLVLGGPQPQPAPPPEGPDAPEPLHRGPGGPHDQGGPDRTVVPPDHRDHRAEQTEEQGHSDHQDGPSQDRHRDEPGEQDAVERQAVDHSEQRSTPGPNAAEGPQQGNQGDEACRTEIEGRKSQGREDAGSRRGGYPWS